MEGRGGGNQFSEPVTGCSYERARHKSPGESEDRPEPLRAAWRSPPTASMLPGRVDHITAVMTAVFENVLCINCHNIIKIVTNLTTRVRLWYQTCCG